MNACCWTTLAAIGSRPDIDRCFLRSQYANGPFTTAASAMPTPTLPLICSAVAILILGYAILSRYLPAWAALAIALIKATIPFVYFWLYFDQCGWTLRDDMRYYGVGAGLLQLGYRPWDLVFDPDGRDILASAAASRHTLYYLWNVVAQYIVGMHYYAAVFFNIGLTFVTGVLLYRTLRLLAFPVRFLQGLLAFHMLHWDYLSWISLINIKEALVEVLLIASVACMVRFVRLRSWAALLGLAICFLLLFMVRIYVPFLLMAAAGVWVMLQWQDSRKWILLPVMIGVLVLVYAKIGADDQQLYPHLMLAGSVRFVLTPQPWTISPTYSFLQVPMILQWLFAIPAVVGAVILWRRSRECRLLVLVLLTFIAFYAMFQAHQGPRHRIQLTALFALVEFQFLAATFHIAASRVRPNGSAL